MYIVPNGKLKGQRFALSGGKFLRPSHANPLFTESCRRVTRPHGNNGVVKSKFRSNLPPHAFGASVRVVRLPLPICLGSLDLRFADAVSLPYLNTVHLSHYYTALLQYDMPP